MKMMSDPLAEMLCKLDANPSLACCFPDVQERYLRGAAAVRAYWRERRPTQEAVARLVRKTRVRLADVWGDDPSSVDGAIADALLALFDRAWEAPRG